MWVTIHTLFKKHIILNQLSLHIHWGDLICLLVRIILFTSRYQKVTFSILKIVEDDSHMCIVYPVDKLVNELSDHEILKLNDDITKIYNRVTGKTCQRLRFKMNMS